jgi:murein L,D-transpeptidase YafK
MPMRSGFFNGRRNGAATGRWAPLCAWLCALLLAPGQAAAETWILIDTRERTLQVLDGEQIVRRYENIAIGQSGAAPRRALGDNQTPLGTFRISSIREETRYHRFFGISYPALDDALRAHRSGKISDADMAAIRRAHELGLEPPPSTPLGGNIGIHGLGGGDPRVHEDFNWTNGCIALTNEQVDDLAGWVRLRMTVVIL